MHETQLHKGVVSKGPFRRSIRRFSRPQVGKSAIPFNWQPIVIPNIKIKNQFSSDSCGGQAGSYLVEILDKDLSNKDIPFSAKSIYAPIRFPGGGVTVYDLERQIADAGVNFEVDVPSYKADGTTDETFMSDKSYRTQELTTKALRDAYKVPKTVDIDMDSIAHAIHDYGAVIIEVQAKNGEDPGWLSEIPTPPSKSNPNPMWAHFVCAVSAGIYKGQKVICFANSWGTTAGLNGFQFFNQAYMDSGNIVDAIAFYPVTLQSNGGPTSSNWLWNIYQKLLHIFLT